MASALHVFDILPAMDENGKELDLTVQATTGLLSYVSHAWQGILTSRAHGSLDLTDEDQSATVKPGLLAPLQWPNFRFRVRCGAPEARALVLVPTRALPQVVGPTPAIEDAPRINHNPGACGLDDRLNDVGPLGKATMRAAGGAALARPTHRGGVAFPAAPDGGRHDGHARPCRTPHLATRRP